MKKLFIRILSYVGVLFFIAYTLTLRLKKMNIKGVKNTALYAYWHQDIIPVVRAFWFQGFSTMASHNKDGEIIAQIAGKLGYRVVRGSRGKGGRSALEEMRALALKGVSGGLAVDGSTGPVFKVKKGIVHLAAQTGLAIIPIAFDFEKKYSLNTWDKMYLPYPFSKGALVCGEPIYVQKDASEDLLEEKRKEVEKSQMSCKKQAELYVKGSNPEGATLQL
jgi:lysophospholipid acyltransferase (LPLAT)-like uncharacterized protein